MLAIGGGLGLVAPSIAEAADTTVVAGPKATGESEATCPEGTHLIGGGYDFGFTDFVSVPPSTSDLLKFTVLTNGPSQSNPDTWVARAFGSQIQAFAVCETDS
ncbi:hypothetical protein [Streptomyces flaveolus]|uniref:hypothetical protein n=1 Tax=Streptomyces flaveolus TaxID=67297 RepID=UPI003400C47C